VEFHVEDHPDPLDIEVLETQVRHEASAAMGLGDEVDLAIFVRDGGTVVAGISGWSRAPDVVCVAEKPPLTAARDWVGVPMHNRPPASRRWPIT
jgi:hypothetical protein